ncbi:MAG: hypothetical protein JRH20_32625 [Deltaproteobacteria bacterium]|nr:hypothetical protein [Deltaproteobacteria bacterium]
MRPFGKPLIISTLLMALSACGSSPLDESHARNSSQLSKPVELLHASSLPYSFRGAGSQPLVFDVLVALVFDVLVADLGRNKEVLIHKTDSDGNWSETLKAQYLATLPDGRERWQAEKAYCVNYACGYDDNGEPETYDFHDFSFYVEYRVNGESYRDDNNGGYYRLGLDDSKLAGHLLPYKRPLFAPTAGVVTIYDWDAPQPVFKRMLNVDIVVANIGSSKKLAMVYSGDGFKTSHRAAAYYLSDYRPHTYASIDNPSGLGTEVWRLGNYHESGVNLATLGDDARVVEYRLEYEVGGETYVDDNFGANYKVAVPIYAKVLLRGTTGPDHFTPYNQMRRKIDGKYRVYYESEVIFENRGNPDRFKFDLKGDWSLTYGENDNGGETTNGVAEEGGGDIIITEGTGRYTVRFYEQTKRFMVERMADSFKRTVVLIEGETEPGQDMFIRGGIDHTYAKTELGRDCDTNQHLCMIRIRHRGWKNKTTKEWKEGDYNLDWYGKEYSQGYRAKTDPEGTPLDWSTNAWPAAWGPKKSYDVDGYGEFSLNTYGPHYWVFDVDMDCDNTVNGFFELKSFISNGPGWEADVSQPGTPYRSGNHFAQCGKLNVFRRGVSAPVAIRDF